MVDEDADAKDGMLSAKRVDDEVEDSGAAKSALVVVDMPFGS